MVCCLVTNLVSAVLQHLQVVLGEDKTAPQLPPLVGVWSVGVQQGSNVGEFPELHGRILRNIPTDISYLNDLQVDIKKSPDEDPEFEVVEGPESPDPLEESFKVKCPVFVLNGVVQPSPGADTDGGGAGSC